MKIEITNELKSHFLNLYEIAITDNSFSPLELKMLYDFARQRNIDKSALQEILLSPHEVFSIPVSLSDRLSYLYDMAKMIWADGIIKEEEKIALTKYARKFEFEEKNITELTEYLLESAKQGKSNEQLIMEIQ